MQNGAIRGLATCAALGVLIVATAASARGGGGYRGHVPGGYHGGVIGGYHGGVIGGYHGGVIGGYHGGVVGGYQGGIGHDAFAPGLSGYGRAGFRRYAFRRGLLPFLFGDIFAFALWPYEYYNPFWTFSANFALESVFAPGIYFVPGYVPYWYYGGLPNIYYSAEGDELARANALAMQGCGRLAPDVSTLLAQRIRQTVHPTAEQESVLDDLISASSKAKETVVASCPKEIPLTPLGRLDAAEKRLEAMIQAVDIVRSPLEKFYDSLSDEQKQRFAAISSRVGAGGGNLAMLCGPQSVGVTTLPEQRIEQAVQPNAQQQDAFDELKKASENATKDLQASCPAQIPQTPVARLDGVTTRLSAMVDALKTVRPKLEDFYASLNDEQKARFNILSLPLQASPQPER